MPHHIPASSAPEARSDARIVRDGAQYDRTVWCITFGRARRLRKRMADLLPLKAGDVVLDVGCGTGDLAFEIVRRVGPSGKVVGLDASPEVIAHAQRKAQRRHLSVEFRVEPAEAFSLPERSVDYAISSLVFHSLASEARRQAVRGIAQVLKEGGEVVVIDFMDTSGHILTHAARHVDTDDLPTLLRAAGFELVRSGPVRFLTAGIPPLGFVRARLPRPEHT